METLSEMEIKQIKMFGCTTAQIKENIDEDIIGYVIGILSDCQEMVTNDIVDSDVETVRLNLNKAKYIIDNFMVKA